MKCPSCKGDIQWGYRGKTCPSCGDPLPERQPLFYEWAGRIVSFTEDRGFFFWLIIFTLFILFLAVLENLFGPGDLAHLLDHHKCVSLLMLIYTAAHLKVIRNIQSVVRPGYPGAYWVDRLIIKEMRRGTNAMLLLGLIVSLVVVGPFNIFSIMPAYVLIISLFTALYWSIKPFRIDDREFMDAKVRSYFAFLGVKRLRPWRQVGGAYLITLVVSAAIFYAFMNMPNLYWNLKMNPTLNEIVNIFKGLFEWVPMLWPEGG